MSIHLENIDLQELNTLIKTITKWNNTIKDYHLICFEFSKITPEIKNALKNFSDYQQTVYGEIKEIKTVDNTTYKEEIVELTELDFSDCFIILRDGVVVASFPLVENHLDNLIKHYSN